MPLPLYYNWRNLAVRRLSTTLTFIVVAAVVFVLTCLLSFAAGIRASLAASGSRNNLLVLAPGATAESTSMIPPDEVNRLVQTPGVARDASGNLLMSREVCVQTSIPRKGANGALANVAVRGVDDVAFDIHSELQLVEGRRFQGGALEVLVGRAAQARYQNLQIGDQLPLGKLGTRTFRIVGVFETSGSALESEIWGPRTTIADAYGRRFVSSALLRLDDDFPADEAIAYINGPAVNLDGKRETRYYEELASKTQEIVLLTTILISIMAVGASFAVANTMFASVDGRRREIAMLRTIGFGRGSIFAALVAEALLICVPACAAALAASMFLDGLKQDFLSDATFTVLAYELKVTPSTVGTALAVAIVVALTGAVAPAVKAGRTRIIESLRKA